MQALCEGKLYANVAGHACKVQKVQFYNGGCAYKVEGFREWFDTLEFEHRLFVFDSK